jgi:hypothetical protein
VFFKTKVCTIYDKYPSKQLIARIEMTNNMMFPLITRNDLTESLNAYKTKALDDSWLYHLIYGHLHFGGLDLMQKKQMVKGLHSIQQPTSSCESCILAKHHRGKFIYGVSYRGKAPLEFFHIDLCGPMKTSSLTGNVYFMIFWMISVGKIGFRYN